MAKTSLHSGYPRIGLQVRKTRRSRAGYCSIIAKANTRCSESG